MRTSLFAITSAALLTVGSVTAADSSGSFGLELMADGFVSPTALTAVPGSDGVLLVTDQVGVIYRVKDGKRLDQPFLDLRPRMAKLNQGFDERGLLGLVVHPKFSNNKKFYVAYSAPRRASAPANFDHTMRISEFTATADGLTGKGDSERVLLEIDQPYFNHNGGGLAFGPDGYLYIGTGDGGNANDRDARNESKGRPPEGNGQHLKTLLGKILRIDVNKGEPYGIPQDNPFVGKEAKEEIWAYGLRNPWRISFDRGGDRQLFVGDVGQDAYEEVDIIVKGGNYGWNIKEGTHCFDPENPRKSPENCPDVGANGEPLIDPILEYKNFKANPRDEDAEGISVTGGYVYRGKNLPAWQGKYVFADWSRAWIKPQGVFFAATKGKDGKWTWEEIKPASPENANLYINSFGEDSEGELYVLTSDSNGLSGTSGRVFKIVPAK